MFILNTVQLLQKTLLSTISCISIMDADSASLAYINMNKKTQLSLTNLRDAKACQKLLQFDAKTSCRQVNNLFEVMEIRCLVIKFLIQITSTYSS